MILFVISTIFFKISTGNDWEYWDIGLGLINT